MSEVRWIFHKIALELLDVTRLVFVNNILHKAPQKEVQRVEIWGMGRPDVLCLEEDYPVAKILSCHVFESV